MLYRGRRSTIERQTGDRLKNLKRKENAPIVGFEFRSTQKSTIPDEMIKRNNINMLSHRFCVAPMMDWTDRHCRVFHRLLTRRARLYTEMLTTGAIIHGDRKRLSGFDASEHPVALQLGGSDACDLPTSAKIGEDFGYDEINLNVGCPSDRVKDGRFGACPACVAASCLGHG